MYLFMSFCSFHLMILVWATTVISRMMFAANTALRRLVLIFSQSFVIWFPPHFTQRGEYLQLGESWPKRTEITLGNLNFLKDYIFTLRQKRLFISQILNEIGVFVIIAIHIGSGIVESLYRLIVLSSKPRALILDLISSSNISVGIPLMTNFRVWAFGREWQLRLCCNHVVWSGHFYTQLVMQAVGRHHISYILRLDFLSGKVFRFIHHFGSVFPSGRVQINRLYFTFQSMIIV